MVISIGWYYHSCPHTLQRIGFALNSGRDLQRTFPVLHFGHLGFMNLGVAGSLILSC